MLPTERLCTRGGLERLGRRSSAGSELGAAAQRDGDVGVIGAQTLLLNGESPLQQRPGLSVAAGLRCRRARFTSAVATFGWSGPSDFSRILRARS